MRKKISEWAAGHEKKLNISNHQGNKLISQRDTIQPVEQLKFLRDLKKLTVPSSCQDMKQLKLSLLMGMQNGTDILKNYTIK